jgi:multimeric flavodoxin WrbA
MNILLVSSSPRKEKSNTLRLARKAVEGMGGSARVETVHLSDLEIGFCAHCEACHADCMRCGIQDDAPALLERMLAADGILFATPNYVNHVTASLKALLERSSHFIHCKRLLGKHLCGVVTSGRGTDDRILLDYLRYYGHICGAQWSGGVSACGYDMEPAMPKALELGRRFARDVSERRSYPAQAGIIRREMAHFKKIIGMRKDHWKGEYAYWKEKGWM